MTESVSVLSLLKCQKKNSQEKKNQVDYQKHNISAEKIQAIMQQILNQKKISF